MKSSFRNLRSGLAFLLPILPEAAAPDWTAIGACYFWLAPLVSAASNAGLAALAFLRIEPGILAALLVLSFYLVRGIRLIDGFADLSDGLTVLIARRTTREKAWEVVRAPARGSFGILWVGILLLGQYSLYRILLGVPVSQAMVLFGLAGASGCLAVQAAHLGQPSYRLDSGFILLGRILSRPIPAVAALVGTLLIGCLLGAAVFPAPQGVLLAWAAVSCPWVTGRLLRMLVLAKLGALNGDFIGFCSLSAEMLTLGGLLFLA